MRSRFALFLSPFGTWRIWPPVANVVSERVDGAEFWRRRVVLQWLFAHAEVRLPDVRELPKRKQGKR